MTNTAHRRLEPAPEPPPWLDEPPPPEDHHQIPREPRPDPTAPPSNHHAEQAVLGAMLFNRDAAVEITAAIDGHHFYYPRHETIYDAIRRRVARLDPIDRHHLANDLRDRGDLTRCGGTVYLDELYQQGIAVPVDSALHYTEEVRRTAARRRLVEAGQRIIALGYTPSDTPPGELHATALNTLERDHILQPVPGVDDNTTHPWAPMDFAAIVDGDLTSPQATTLARRDGKHLLYPYSVHSIAGEPGALKTWVALLGIVQELDAGNNVALIDFEDRGQSVAARLLQIGADPQHLRDPTRWRYLRPDVALDATGTSHLDRAVAGCTLVVIDGVTEAMSIHGMSVNDNDDVARFIHLLPRRIADTGPAVLQVDHVTKDSETRGRYAIGGQHKLAAITGTAMKALVVRSGGRGEHGIVKVVLDKDKHGDVGPSGATIAEFHLDDTTPGKTYAWLDHPTRSVDDDGHFRPTILMKRVSDYLLAVPRACSLREIRQGVKGNAASIAQAVDALVREGHIRIEQGPNRAVMHHLVTAFEETT